MLPLNASPSLEANKLKVFEVMKPKGPKLDNRKSDNVTYACSPRIDFSFFAFYCLTF